MRPRALAALAAVIAVACSTGSSSSSAGAIRVQLAGEQEEIAVYEALVSTFEKKHPDIEVQLVPVADKDDHLARLATGFAAGDPPEVFLVNFREFSQFASRGALEPIEPHLDAAGIDIAEYFRPAIDAFTYRGVLQCMPQNVSNLVVYYNQELFTRARLNHPPSDWTWETFRDYARTLSRGDVDGVGIDPSIIRIAPFVWQNGGDIVDDDVRPSAFALREPRAAQAIAFVAGLFRDGLTPTEQEVASQDLETRFAAGKLGMLLESRKETPAFREVLGLQWDVAPLPRRTRPASILHSDAYCVATGSEHVEAAATFVSFAAGREGQIVTALGGRTVPSLRAVARSGAFLDPTRAPEHSEAFLAQVPFLKATPVIPTWPEIEDISEEIFTRIFYEEGYTIDEGLADLDERTRVLFEEGSEP